MTLYEDGIKSKRFHNGERRITCACGSRRVEVVELQNGRPDVIKPNDISDFAPDVWLLVRCGACKRTLYYNGA